MSKSRINVTVDDEALLDAQKKGKNISALCNRALRREMKNNVWARERIRERITEAEEEKAHQEEMLHVLEKEQNQAIQERLFMGDLDAAAEFIVKNNIFPSTETQWENNALDWGVSPAKLREAVEKIREEKK